MNARTGLLLLPGASSCELVPGTIRFEAGGAGRITHIEREPALVASPNLMVIAPGLIDLHVHGYGGADPYTDLAGMATALARAGTTGFQPTLFPSAPSALGAVAARIWSAAAELGSSSARVLGLHLEGPFVNPLAAGALPLEDLAEPSVEALRAILGPATGDGRGVRTMTLAPELVGAGALIAELERASIRASFGHSRASAKEARDALRAGQSARGTAGFGVTHLFNAMTGLHHRDPGLASLALTDEALSVELIGDLVHVGPEAIELALAARGPAGIALVSDALVGAGTGCDVFHSHGRAHRIHDGAVWYPAEAETPECLAGSATGQLDAIRGLVAAGVLGLADALTMASLAPARALGLESEVGRLAIGARADLLVLEGPGLALTEVLIGGLLAG